MPARYCEGALMLSASISSWQGCVGAALGLLFPHMPMAVVVWVPLPSVQVTMLSERSMCHTNRPPYSK